MKLLAVLLLPIASWIPNIPVPADAGSPAVRLDPVVLDLGPIPDVTTTTAPSYDSNGQHVPYRCPEWEGLLVQYAPAGGWDISRMSGYAWRESNCQPTVRSRTSDSGLLQINDINLPFLRKTLGEPVDRYTLLDPIQNVRAAAALCVYWESHGGTCYTPWKRK